MLKGFAVENFKSFNKTQSISFAASKIVRHKDHVADISGKRILKSGLIYGANAGGKSNLVQALSFSREIVLSGLDRVNLSKKHFRISEDSYNRPGVFQYDIVTDDNEYLYGVVISYVKKEIVGEWLIRVSKSGAEFVIFDREVDDNGVSHVETDLYDRHKGFARLKVYFEDYGEDISASLRQKSILNDIATRSKEDDGPVKEIIAVYQWFRDMIIIFPNLKYNLINEIATSEKRRDFFQNILGYFDTGIETVSGQLREMDFDKVFADMPAEQADEIKIQLSQEAAGHPITMRIGEQAVILRKDDDGNIIYNKLMLGHGNPEDLFEYSDESDGTKRLFDLIPLLYKSSYPHVIVIDEIDRSLHTNIVRKFLERFYAATDGGQSQLIATTHDSNIMDLDLLRQDEIWFVERQTDHSSKIFSLNKFKERFDKVVRNDYLLGRYGAIPIFNSDFLMEVDDNAE